MNWAQMFFLTLPVQKWDFFLTLYNLLDSCWLENPFVLMFQLVFHNVCGGHYHYVINIFLLGEIQTQVKGQSLWNWFLANGLVTLGTVPGVTPMDRVIRHVGMLGEWKSGSWSQSWSSGSELFIWLFTGFNNYSSVYNPRHGASSVYRIPLSSSNHALKKVLVFGFVFQEKGTMRGD